MTIQAILFILLVSAFYGCVAHLIFGGNVFSIFINILIAIAGFFVGHFIGNIIGREFIQVGMINFGWGTFLSIIFLTVGGFLSHPIF